MTGPCGSCGGEMIPTGCTAESCDDPRMCLECGAGCDLLTGGVCDVIAEWQETELAP
jgi:hypothetical protein